MNKAGTYYGLDSAGNPFATPCPADTFGFGYRKQRACAPCPSGYTTNGVTGQRYISDCGEDLGTGCNGLQVANSMRKPKSLLLVPHIQLYLWDRGLHPDGPGQQWLLLQMCVACHAVSTWNCVVTLSLCQQHDRRSERLMFCKVRPACCMLLLLAEVPEGYYLQGPGQVAPCPRGEYSNGPYVAGSSTCTKCAVGVTTPDVASTSEANCTVLWHSYYAASIENGIIKSATKCPQSFICPGGQPSAVFDPAQPTALAGTTVQQCPHGTYTEYVGALTVDSCSKSLGLRGFARVCFQALCSLQQAYHETVQPGAGHPAGADACT